MTDFDWGSKNLPLWWGKLVWLFTEEGEAECGRSQIVAVHIPRCLVGSGPQCGLRISDPRLYPVECLLLTTPQGLFTWNISGRALKNRRPFEKVSLHTGDVLSVGPVEITLGGINPRPQPDQSWQAVKLWTCPLPWGETQLDSAGVFSLGEYPRAAFGSVSPRGNDSGHFAVPGPQLFADGWTSAEVVGLLKSGGDPTQTPCQDGGMGFSVLLATPWPRWDGREARSWSDRSPSGGKGPWKPAGYDTPEGGTDDAIGGEGFHPVGPAMPGTFGSGPSREPSVAASSQDAGCIPTHSPQFRGVSIHRNTSPPSSEWKTILTELRKLRKQLRRLRKTNGNKPAPASFSGELRLAGLVPPGGPTLSTENPRETDTPEGLGGSGTHRQASRAAEGELTITAEAEICGCESQPVQTLVSEEERQVVPSRTPHQEKEIPYGGVESRRRYQEAPSNTGVPNTGEQPLSHGEPRFPSHFEVNADPERGAGLRAGQLKPLPPGEPDVNTEDQVVRAVRVIASDWDGGFAIHKDREHDPKEEGPERKERGGKTSDETIPDVPESAANRRANATHPRETATDTAEEEINAYLRRLLERLRSEGSVAGTPVVGAPQEQATEGGDHRHEGGRLDPEDGGGIGASGEGLLSDLRSRFTFGKRVKNQKAPARAEASVDVDSFRMLASHSARSALTEYQRRRFRQSARGKLWTAALALGAAGTLLGIAGFAPYPPPALMGAWVAIGIAVVMVVCYLGLMARVAALWLEQRRIDQQTSQTATALALQHLTRRDTFSPQGVDTRQESSRPRCSPQVCSGQSQSPA